jgi:pentatricopeptide repeat protein
MPEEAYKIHQNMKVKPTTDSFNSLIHAFSKAKNPEAVEAAESIFNEMTIANVNKDLITYCTMLACWSHTSHPDKAQRARNVLDQLKSTFQSLALKLPGASEVLRNAHTMVLAACAHLPHHSGQTEQALRIAHVTFSEVENPNHITYATYIQSVSRLEKDVERKKESAKSIFLRYCEEEKEEISPLLLRKLEAILSSKEYEDVVTLGRNLQRQDQ